MRPLLLTAWSRWRRPRAQWRGPARCSPQPLPGTGTALGRAPALRASGGDALRTGHGGGETRGVGKVPGPGEDSLQQASPSSSTAILLLRAGRTSPRTCSQPLSSTAGHRAGTSLGGTGAEQSPGSLGTGRWIAPPWRVSKCSHNTIFFPLFLASHLARFKDILSQTPHPSQPFNQLPEGMDLSSLHSRTPQTQHPRAEPSVAAPCLV